jgi:hypothetical protein
MLCLQPDRDCANSREDLNWLLDRGVDAGLTDLYRQDDGFNLGGQLDRSLKVLNNIAKNGDIELFDHIVSPGADPLRSMSLHAVSLCRDAEKMAAMIDHLLDHYHMDIEADNENLRGIIQALPDSGPPLVCAIYHENIAAVQKLLDRGADVKGPRFVIAQAIGTLFFGGFLPALGPLLDAGADVDQAFRYAVFRNNIDAARICFKRGADPTRTLEKWRRMIKRRAREMSDSESDDGHSETEAEEAIEEPEEEDEEEVERRNKMSNFLETISIAPTSTA